MMRHEVNRKGQQLSIQRREEWTSWLLPLSFVLSSITNFIFYYLGLAMEENIAREVGFIVVQLVFAVIAGLAWLFFVWKRKFPTRGLVLSMISLLFFLCCYGIWFVLFGTKNDWLGKASQFIVFAIPALFCGMMAAEDRLEEKFFEHIETLSLLVLPGAIIYLNGALFQCNPFNYGRDFGIISYMTFSYTLMPFLLVHILRFCDHAPLPYRWRGKRIQHQQLVRGILIGWYWYTILASGTRGTYVCVLTFALLLIISRAIHRESLKAASVIAGSMALVFAFTLFIYRLPGLKQVGRMDEVVAGLLQGELVTSEEDSSVSEHLDEIIAMEGDEQVVNKPDTPSTEPDTPSTEPDTPSTAPTDSAVDHLQINSRGTIYKVAFGEFLKSPLTGMGPGGYGIKYGGYPHNAVLELFCETGLVGGVILLTLTLTALIRILMAGWNRKEVRWILLFFLAYGVQANISGSLWTCSPLLCALGYGLTIATKDVGKEA